MVVTALACALSVAWAQNVRFTKASATLAGPDLVVSWKEGGLGGNQNINYVASAYAVATYVCVTSGGACHDVSNQLRVEGPVTATGTFMSGKNGSVTASLTLEPLGPPNYACPGDLRLSTVSYSNIQITDNNNNITKTTTPSAISATLFECP